MRVRRIGRAAPAGEHERAQLLPSLRRESGPVLRAGEARARATASASNDRRGRLGSSDEEKRARRSCMAPRPATLARKSCGPARRTTFQAPAFTCRRARPFSACGLRLCAADNAGLRSCDPWSSRPCCSPERPEFRHACARKATPRVAVETATAAARRTTTPRRAIVLDNAAFEQRLAQSEQLVKNSQPTVTLGGYLDVGYFVPGGNNGGGLRRGFRPPCFPSGWGGFGWVFLGDILAPAVNSPWRGGQSGARAWRQSLRHHQLARRARVHRQRNQRDPPLGADADGADHRRASTSRPARAATSRWAIRSTSTSPRSNGCRPTRSARRSSSARWIRCSASSTAIASPTGASASRRRLIARYTTGTALGAEGAHASSAPATGWCWRSR